MTTTTMTTTTIRTIRTVRTTRTIRTTTPTTARAAGRVRGPRRRRRRASVLARYAEEARRPPARKGPSPIRWGRGRGGRRDRARAGRGGDRPSWVGGDGASSVAQEWRCPPQTTGRSRRRSRQGPSRDSPPRGVGDPGNRAHVHGRARHRAARGFAQHGGRRGESGARPRGSTSGDSGCEEEARGAEALSERGPLGEAPRREAAERRHPRDYAGGEGRRGLQLLQGAGETVRGYVRTLTAQYRIASYRDTDAGIYGATASVAAFVRAHRLGDGLARTYAMRLVGRPSRARRRPGGVR